MQTINNKQDQQFYIAGQRHFDGKPPLGWHSQLIWSHQKFGHILEHKTWQHGRLEPTWFGTVHECARWIYTFTFFHTWIMATWHDSTWNGQPYAQPWSIRLQSTGTELCASSSCCGYASCLSGFKTTVQWPVHDVSASWLCTRASWTPWHL